MSCADKRTALLLWTVINLTVDGVTVMVSLLLILHPTVLFLFFFFFKQLIPFLLHWQLVRDNSKVLVGTPDPIGPVSGNINVVSVPCFDQ